jgi:membrane protease YdiL (CAAX protease family)
MTEPDHAAERLVQIDAPRIGGASARQAEASSAASLGPVVIDAAEPFGPRAPATPAGRGPWLSVLLLLYLAALAGAEVAVTYVNPVFVFGLHGAIIVGILIALSASVGTAPDAVDGGRSGARSDPPRDRDGLTAAEHVEVSAALENHAAARVVGQRRLAGSWPQMNALAGALLVPPLVRLISLTLPLAQIEPVWRYAAAGVPMGFAAILVARASGLSLADLGLRWRGSLWQISVVLISVGLGFVEFTILRPAPLGSLPWTLAGAGPALLLGLSTSLPEELIFRGLLQTALRPVLARWTVLYAAAVFAVLHIGYRSATDLVFVFCVGLIFGFVFERTRSIIGTTIGHGVANVVLFFVAPNLALLLPTLNFP